MYCDFSFTGGLRDIVKGNVCRPVCDSVHWKGGGVVVSVRGVSFQGGLCLGGGGLCPGGWVSVQGISVQWCLCPVGSLARGSLSSGVSVQGVSVQGGLCPGGLCPGGSLSGS